MGGTWSFPEESLCVNVLEHVHETLKSVKTHLVLSPAPTKPLKEGPGNTTPFPTFRPTSSSKSKQGMMGGTGGKGKGKGSRAPAAIIENTAWPSSTFQPSDPSTAAPSPGPSKGKGRHSPTSGFVANQFDVVDSWGSPTWEPSPYNSNLQLDVVTDDDWSEESPTSFPSESTPSTVAPTGPAFKTSKTAAAAQGTTNGAKGKAAGQNKRRFLRDRSRESI